MLSSQNWSSGAPYLTANIRFMLNQSRKNLFLSLCKQKYCHLLQLQTKTTSLLSQTLLSCGGAILAASVLKLPVQALIFLRLVDFRSTFHSRRRKLAVRQVLLFSFINQGYCYPCQTVSYKTGEQTQQVGSFCVTC